MIVHRSSSPLKGPNALKELYLTYNIYLIIDLRLQTRDSWYDYFEEGITR